MVLVTVIRVLFPWVFFWAWQKARNVLRTENEDQYLCIVSLENGDLMSAQKRNHYKNDTEFYW